MYILLLFMCILIHGFLNDFSLLHLGTAFVFLTIMLFNFVTTFWLILICGILAFVLNYNLIEKSFCIFKKTLKTMIQITTYSPGNITQEDIQTMKSIKKNIDWCEDVAKYISDYYHEIKKSTQMFVRKFDDTFKKSVIYADIAYLWTCCITVFEHFLANITDISKIIFELSVEIPIIGEYISYTKRYYLVGSKLCSIDKDVNTTNNLINSPTNSTDSINITTSSIDTKEPNVLDAIDGMNNLIDMMMPALENLNQLNQSNQFNSTNKLNQSTVPMSIPAQFKMPSQNEMENMLKALSNIQSNTQQSVNKKKKKK